MESQTWKSSFELKIPFKLQLHHTVLKYHTCLKLHSSMEEHFDIWPSLQIFGSAQQLNQQSWLTNNVKMILFSDVFCFSSCPERSFHKWVAKIFRKGCRPTIKSCTHKLWMSACVQRKMLWNLLLGHSCWYLHKQDYQSRKTAVCNVKLDATFTLD